MTAQKDADWLDRVYGAGGDRDRLAAAYDDWAETYDDVVASYGYRHLPYVIAMLCRHLHPGAGSVLDAGAGTGLIGQSLALLGYDDLVGIDLSAGMLARAARRGCYGELRSMALGGPLDFPDDRFAAVVSAGVLTVGHAPPESFAELIRVTKPAGYLVFSVSDPALVDGGFQAEMQRLEQAGLWRAADRTLPYDSMPHAGADHAVLGRVYVYQVCAGGSGS